MSTFVWVAHYRDRKHIKSTENISFDKIPRHNLWYVDLIAPTNKKILTLTFRPGYNVFYRRRAIMSPGSATMEAVHLLGYQVKGSDVSAVAFLYESDWRIDISDFKNANDRMASMKEYKEQIIMLPGDLEEIVWD